MYMGNVRGHPGENTYCPGCRKVLIRRAGYAILDKRIVDGKCPDCARAIPGVWA